MEDRKARRASCLNAARAFGAGITAARLAAFDASRRALTPADLAALDQPLRRALYDLDWGNRRALPWRARPMARRTALMEVLTNPETTAAALLLLHDGDGHLREVALKMMPDPVGDPAALAALLLRCNDWAKPVRHEAQQRLEATKPALSTTDLMAIAPLTLERSGQWQRGGEAALSSLMHSPYWEDAVTRLLETGRTGPLARLLRQSQKAGQMDGALVRLAQNAASSQVRAAATEVVLTGTARWREGTRWVWTNKVWGQKHRETVLGSRPVQTSPANRLAVLDCAAKDQSATVRKLAADHLIRVGPALPSGMVQALTTDKNPAVAERMTYYHRKWSGKAATITS